MYKNIFRILILVLFGFSNNLTAKPKIFLINNPTATPKISIDQSRLIQIKSKSIPINAPNGESFEFFEDFEGQFPAGNWNAYDIDDDVNGEYYWGKTGQRKFSGEASVWCAADGADGYDPSEGEYPPYCNSAMTWGPMDLTTAASAKFFLRFWLESDDAMEYDGIYWGATKGDSLLVKEYSGSSGGWMLDSLDIQDIDGVNWLGSKEVYFIVLFLSDPAISAEGAYVDDVRISVQESAAPGFTELQTNITSMKNGTVCWGDFNNDTRLDLLLTGTKNGDYYAKIYQNQPDDEFYDINANLAPLAGGNSCWADFNNDGYLDILHAGFDGTQDILKIYFNERNGTFSDARANLTPREYIFANYADFDNDGDLDLVVTGSTGYQPLTDFYKNNGEGEFERVDTELESNVYNGTIITGDYDNDGDIDLVLTGRSGSRAQTLLYRNDGAFSFTEINPHFEDLEKASGAFGDYDNDGDLDLLLTGRDVAENGYTIVYRNNGGDNFSRIQDYFHQSRDGSAAWGDYDNDGVLDILLSGFNDRHDYIQIYHNEGSDYFTRIDDEFPDVAGPCAWADFDNDDDLDVFISGWNGSRNYEATLFRNNSQVANRKPHAPRELSSAVTDNSVQLSWDDAADDATPSAGLSYNLYIGKTVRNDEIMPSHSHHNSGLRKIVATGNGQKLTHWQIQHLPAGEYFWSVQAVDAAFAGSRFPADETFTIAGTNLVLLAPNGGEIWEADSLKTIRWNVTSLQQVNLEYSTDNGNSWEMIAASIPANPPTYSWQVPPTPSTSCLVRVSDAEDASRFDVSDAPFTIFQPTLTLTAPNGGENWAAGSQQTITWTAEHIQEIDLRYSTDRGENWELITENYNATLKTFSWTVPAVSSGECLVKIIDAANALRTDTSDAVFTVFQPSIRVQTPNGGEFWRVDSTREITWESENVNYLKIEYSHDSTTTWQIIEAKHPAEPSLFEWRIPKTRSNHCFVRLTDFENPHISDVSDSAFTIFMPNLNLTAPVGGEVWQADSIYQLTWTSANIDSVWLEFSGDGGDSWERISENLPAVVGSFAWQAPKISTNEGYIRISDVADASLSDTHENSFSILNPEVTLIAPNGGEKIFSDSKFEIQWTARDFETVQLDYSLDNQGTWNSIADSVAAQGGKFSWKVPNAESNKCRIRITDRHNQNVSDVSDSTFTILKPEILLVAPNGGENWSVDSTYQIVWQAHGIERLKIAFSADAGENWQTLADTVNADSLHFSWQPESISDSCRVRICNLENNLICDESDSVFSIYQPVLQLLSPVGGEKLVAGSTHEIQWFTEYIEFVDILFSANNGTDWDTLATVIGSGTGFQWNVPDLVSEECLVKIVNPVNLNYFDLSDSTFTIFEPTQSVKPEQATAPQDFVLYQNYPNPFNPVTHIRFTLPQSGRVQLRIFNFQGREIETLINGEKSAGIHTVTFDASKLASGIYFYELKTPQFNATRKMLLLK